MPTRLLRATGFRIALLYLLLLSATLLVLVGVIYWSTAALIEGQAKDTVDAEIRGLAEQYADECHHRLFLQPRFHRFAAQEDGQY